MVGDLNAAIVASLCGEDTATVVAHTHVFAGLGSQVCHYVCHIVCHRKMNAKSELEHIAEPFNI